MTDMTDDEIRAWIAPVRRGGVNINGGALNDICNAALSARAERDELADQVASLLPSVNREAVEQRTRAEAAEAEVTALQSTPANVAWKCPKGAVGTDCCGGYCAMDDATKGDGDE